MAPLISFTVYGKTILIFLHLVGAVAWIGALMFYVIIFSYVIERESAYEKGKRILKASRRLDLIAWASLILLLFTGIWNTIYNPVSEMYLKHEVQTLEDFWMLWETPFGSAFMIKHVLFVVFFVLMVYRSFRIFRTLKRAVVTMDALGIRAAEESLEKVSRIILVFGYLILFFSAIILFSLR